MAHTAADGTRPKPGTETPISAYMRTANANPPMTSRAVDSIMNPMFLVTIVVLVAILAASAVALHSYHAEMNRTRTAASKGANLATTTAGPIEYAEKGSGMPLLSIHRAGGGFDQGIANAAELFGDGYRIIAPSRFGYLDTPVPEDSSPAAQADAHAALLTELKVDKVLVVGISAGTRSALELVLRHPERVASLILIVPATYAPASPVVIENSSASRFAFWLVNAGADFVWWATEKIVPSALIRFIGVPPEVVAAAPKADQDRVMQIVRSVQPLSRRSRSLTRARQPAVLRLAVPVSAGKLRLNLRSFWECQP